MLNVKVSKTLIRTIQLFFHQNINFNSCLYCDNICNLRFKFWLLYRITYCHNCHFKILTAAVTKCRSLKYLLFFCLLEMKLTAWIYLALFIVVQHHDLMCGLNHFPLNGWVHPQTEWNVLNPWGLSAFIIALHKRTNVFHERNNDPNWS